MDSRYNLSELFSKAFGINSPIFITEQIDQTRQNGLDYSGITYLPDYYKSDVKSMLGTYVIGLLKFKTGNYPIYTPNGAIATIPFEQLILPASTLFSFRRAKNITKTNLLGNNGTIKEIFGFDDWIIDVKGLCLDNDKFSAREQLQQIELWEEIAGSIAVGGDLLSSKKIQSVVIEDYRQEAVQGSPGVIPFSMTLCSDEAVELILRAS